MAHDRAGRPGSEAARGWGRGKASYRVSRINGDEGVASLRRPLPLLSLLFDFNDVPSYHLGELVTLGCNVRPGFRLVECHSLIHARPFGDPHTLGGRPPLYLNHSSGRGAQTLTVGCFDHLAGGRKARSSGCSIEGFELSDSV